MAGKEFLAYNTPALDARFKILPEDYDAVRRDYTQFKSQRKTAAKWGVTRNVIRWIVFPEQAEAYKARRKARKPWLTYYDKASHTEAVQRYRLKKKELGIPRKEPQAAGDNGGKSILPI